MLVVMLGRRFSIEVEGWFQWFLGHKGSPEVGGKAFILYYICSAS